MPVAIESLDTFGVRTLKFIMRIALHSGDSLAAPSLVAVADALHSGDSLAAPSLAAVVDPPSPNDVWAQRCADGEERV